MREELGGLKLARGGLVLAQNRQSLLQNGLELLLDVLSQLAAVDELGEGDVREVEEDLAPRGDRRVRPVARVLGVVRSVDRSEARGLDLPGLLGVRGAHQGAPRRNRADLGHAQGVNGPARHEADQVGKERLPLVLPVKLLGLRFGQLREKRTSSRKEVATHDESVGKGGVRESGQHTKSQDRRSNSRGAATYLHVFLRYDVKPVRLNGVHNVASLPRGHGVRLNHGEGDLVGEARIQLNYHLSRSSILRSVRPSLALFSFRFGSTPATSVSNHLSLESTIGEGNGHVFPVPSGAESPARSGLGRKSVKGVAFSTRFARLCSSLVVVRRHQPALSFEGVSCGGPQRHEVNEEDFHISW